MQLSKRYDYVVVGAGTAGSALASRLSEDPGVRVLLLEAGAEEPLDLMAIPRAWPALAGSSADWGDSSTEQRFAGRAMPLPRGRGMGGSSSINGLAFVRGHRSSYDSWPDQGAVGWAYDDLLPFFKRSENAPGRDDSVRGTGGPLTVTPPAEPNPVITACVQAAVEVGHRRVEDYSSGLEIGFGWPDNNIVDGVRQSAADAYLRPILDRPNLDVFCEVMVRRLQIVDGRCIGVEYAAGDQLVSVGCTREVVLCAGAIGSPQLLMVSGVGPQRHLREVGVAPVLDLPGVGANLQDHPASTLTYALKQPMPVIPANPLGEALGLVRTDAALDAPDLQILFGGFAPLTPLLKGPDEGYTMLFSVMNPRSRGTVRLASPDAEAAPLIDPNYLSDDRDVATIMAGLRMAREIGQACALTDWRGEEILPGPMARDNDAVRDYLRQSLTCYYHYCGTCRIGDDDMAVVDTELRVRGLTGLRVADASVMPSIVSGNTNATVCAIAERAAHLINPPQQSSLER
ncbi:GMC family oxidoreductase N-terminal domain-containing protein [Amycolatopsis sp. NPDC023774]|uniref:GMC family oxidoreductase n=1 Tax=Amycolatopsis sp. NPDC023774 TaxID=3155015 RepID=UPI0034108CB2